MPDTQSNAGGNGSGSGRTSGSSGGEPGGNPVLDEVERTGTVSEETGPVASPD